MSVEAEVAGRYAAIRERIDAACGRAGRDPADVTLLGASKSQPVERMRAARAAGLEIFGENRVQEAEAKRPELPPDTLWHLIGPLQSNKAKRAAALFSAVHSVDRPKIARFLDREAARLGHTLDGFLEVNLGGEETKHGFPAEGLAERVSELAYLRSLKIRGLMAIPPLETDPDRIRAWFVELRELRNALAERPEWRDRLVWLSMGMSDDYEIAIEEGATHVRVGTALFGARE